MKLESISTALLILSSVAGGTYAACNHFLVEPLRTKNEELERERNPYKKQNEELIAAVNDLKGRNAQLDASLSQWKASLHDWRAAKESCDAQLATANRNGSVIQHIYALKREKNSVESALTIYASEDLRRQSRELHELIQIAESKLSCQ